MRRSTNTVILSSILLFATLCQPISAAEPLTTGESSSITALPSESSSASSGNSSSRPDASLSDPLLSALYDCINNGNALVTYESKTYLSNDYLRELMIGLLEDYPEFFYLDHISMSYTIYQNADGSLKSCIYEFEPVYTIASKEQIAAAKTEWEGMLSDILQTVPSTMTDLEKALVLHDYLCINFSYDASLAVSDSYTFLKEKTGVCEAYADTYSALLTRLGIDNKFAISPEMNHVWNVIKLDGQWYHVDITWDDPLNGDFKDQPGKALHTAFLRSDNGMLELGHKSWICDVSCTSHKYENSLFSEIVGAVATDGRSFYAVSNEQRAILRCDLDSLTTEPIVDLSSHRWYVWGDSSFWNACFSNLYCDGEWLYFSTPTGIDAYDLASGKIIPICTYDKGDGYLYSMRYENHHLICTVSTTPAVTESEFIFKTRHLYQPTTVEGIFATLKCTECDEVSSGIAPPDGSPIAVAASVRPTPNTDGFHDIRIVMAVDSVGAGTLGPLEYVFSLERTDGSKDTLLFHSKNNMFDEFQQYDTLSAGTTVYNADKDHLLLGFYVSSVADASWTRVGLTITQTATQAILYDGSLGYEQLIA